MGNIDIDALCNQVRNYSRGLYIAGDSPPSSALSGNQNNVMENSGNRLPFLSKSCKIFKRDNLNLEIFLAPLFFSRKYGHNALAAVSCSSNVCHPETVLYVDKFKERYPLLQFGMCCSFGFDFAN